MTAAPRRQRSALLLSQLGDLASSLFAAGAASAGVTATEAAVVRLIGRSRELSQRQLADRVGAPPSRVVALLDSLEERGLVLRRRSEADRRRHVLSLTDEGRELLARLTAVVTEQERVLLAPLDPEEAASFVDTLARLAQAHGIDPEVHRGVGVSTGRGGAVDRR